MSVALDTISARLARFGAVLAHWIRGGKPPPAKRWSRTFVINLVSGVALVGYVGINLFGSLFTIGINEQDVRCLPGTVFLESNRPPVHSELSRGTKYWYRSGPEFARFLPLGVPIVKKLAALPGDRVKVDASGIWINDVKWGDLSDHVLHSLGETPASVTRSFVVAADEVLMLGTLPRSLDGRYLGPIKTDRLSGQVWRIW
jgi:conjugal transfer pilin signal peptidase TrbI